MFRYCSIALAICFANICAAQNVCPIVFEDEAIVMGGEKIRSHFYYILLGDTGTFETGDLVQITQPANQPGQYYHTAAKYTLEKDVLTVYWPAGEGRRVGSVEKGRLTQYGSDGQRFKYHITSHDDNSQVGEKMNVRIVSSMQLPTWVQNAIRPYVVAKMSPDQRRIYNQQQLLLHRMQAESLETTRKIMDMYLNN